MGFPWGVSAGLGLVLAGVLVAIIYILVLDRIES